MNMNFLRAALFALSVALFITSSADVRAQGWVAGTEVVILSPVADENAAFTIETQGGGATINSNTLFDSSATVAPRFWLAHVNDDGFQTRGQFWFFDSNDSQSIVAGPNDTLSTGFLGTQSAEAQNPGGSATASMSRQIYIYDLDFSQLLSVRRGALNVGGGLRIASLSRKYDGRILDPIAGPITSTGKVETVAAGLSLFAEYERPITSTISGFADLRTSMLFGQADIDGVSVEPGTTTVDNLTLDDILSIHEVRCGLQTTRTLWGRSVFASSFLEAQLYESADSTLLDFGLIGGGFQLGFIY